MPESLQFELFAVDPDGSNLIELMPDYPRGFGLPRWSWAGDLIAATSMGRDGFETIVPSVPTRTIHLQPPDPTLTLSCAGWSPDRVHLICEGWSPTKAGREGLYTVLSSNGGEPTQLTKPPDGIHDVPGDYSADGSQIAFVRASYPPVHLGEIWICNADGSNARKITDTLVGYRISWSKDGRWIVGERDGNLFVFDLQNLAVDPQKIVIPGGSATEPRWSPDGTRIVFVYRKTGSPWSQIALVARDGSGFVTITSGNIDGSPDWGSPGF